MLEQVLRGVWLVVVGTGVAYAIFKRLGEKWLDAKFEQRLAAYKHEQQKELEQLRFKINALLDRATKLHQREFEVLPEAWALLNDAFWRALTFVASFQQYPDLDRMLEPGLEEFLARCPLSQWEKDELRAEKDRTTYYIKHIFWHRLGEVKAAARASHVYLLKHGIFVSADLRTGFEGLDELIWGAIEERELNEEYRELPKQSEKVKDLQSKGQELLKKLEADVRGRLWNSEERAL